MWKEFFEFKDEKSKDSQKKNQFNLNHLENIELTLMK